MSMKTFRQAVKIAEDYCESIAIGGGEPTIHPSFWEIVGYCLGHFEYVWLATNGKRTQTALALARMARRGVIGVDLSQDPWHSPIDNRVVEAFTRSKARGFPSDSTDLRNIRNVENGVINAGRCDWGKDGCVCPEIQIDPQGIIKQCGCADSPIIGNVFDGLTIDYAGDDCWKTLKELEEEEE